MAIDGVRVKRSRSTGRRPKTSGSSTATTTSNRVEHYYSFADDDVLAVADGTVVSIHHDMPDQTAFVFMVPKSKPDYGGKNMILEIARNGFAWYAHCPTHSLGIHKTWAPIVDLDFSLI